MRHESLAPIAKALFDEVGRREEEGRPVGYASMKPFERPLFDEMVRLGVITPEQDEGIFIEYEGVTEFEYIPMCSVEDILNTDAHEERWIVVQLNGEVTQS